MKILAIIKTFTVAADLIGQNRLGNDVLYYLRSFHAENNIRSIRMQIVTFLDVNYEKFQKPCRPVSPAKRAFQAPFSVVRFF